MLTIILFILGATCVYTGLLVFDREVLSGVIAVIVGIALLVSPAIEVLRLIKPHVGRAPRSTDKPGGGDRRKGHLRAVRPKENRDEERPTIH